MGGLEAVIGALEMDESPKGSEYRFWRREPFPFCAMLRFAWPESLGEDTDGS